MTKHPLKLTQEANSTTPTARLIDLDKIDTNSGTESRPLHDDVVDDYANAWTAGADFPPVDLFWDGTRLRVSGWPWQGRYNLSGLASRDFRRLVAVSTTMQSVVRV